MNAPPPYPASQQPYQPPPKKGMPAFLIVVICVGALLFFVLPVFSVLAVYGVRKYIANAKMAEARQSLVQIGKDAASKAAVTGAFCPSATRGVPADARTISGMKYQSSPEDWQVDQRQSAGFACLGFSLDQPQYYQYTYTSKAPKHDRFVAGAYGDLNGDGVFSSFSLTGTIDADRTVTLAPQLVEESPNE